MSIEAEGRNKEVPLADNSTLAQRREDMFVQLSLELIRLQKAPEAKRIAAIFEDAASTEETKQQAVNDLRTIIIDFRAYPELHMPTLGNVLGKAYELAHIDDQQIIATLIDQFVTRHDDVPISLYRRAHALTGVV